MSSAASSVALVHSPTNGGVAGKAGGGGAGVSTPPLFRIADRLRADMCAAFPSNRSNASIRASSSSEAWRQAKARVLQVAHKAVKLSGSVRDFRRVAWLWGSGAVQLANSVTGAALECPDLCPDRDFASMLSAAVGIVGPPPSRTGAGASGGGDGPGTVSAAVREEQLNSALRGIHATLRHGISASGGGCLLYTSPSPRDRG